MSGIKGYPAQKKIVGDISGYGFQQTQTESQFVTAQYTSSDKVVLNTTTSGLFKVSGTTKAAEAGSTKRLLKITAHGALKGDVIRFEAATANPYVEMQVNAIPDADTIILGGELANTIVTGDQFYLLRYVTPVYGSDGSLSTSSGPVQFVKNGTTVTVNEDTVTPANSRPLPVNVLNSSGVIIDPATGAKQDTGNTSLASIDTKLTTTNSSLASIDGKTPALGQALAAASVPVVLTAAQVTTLTPLSTVAATQSGTWNITNVSGTVSLPTGAATSANQTSELTQLGIVTETAPASDTASSGLNGRLQRIAQRLTSLIALLPTSIGQKAMTGSLSVTIASDQSNIPFYASAPSGSFSSITNLTTTAQTFTAPANAIGFKIQFPSDQTAPGIRWCIGATASTTSGIYMEQGRSEDFDCAGNISVCAVSGTSQTVFVQWRLKV